MPSVVILIASPAEMTTPSSPFMTFQLKVLFSFRANTPIFLARGDLPFGIEGKNDASI